MLVDGEAVVWDSSRILRRLEQRFPEPTLYGADPAARAGAELFVDWFDRVWKRAPNEIEAELGRPRPDADRIEACAEAMRRHLDLFERLLSGRPFLLGDFGVADCTAFPFLCYAAGRPPGDDELFHRILEEHQPLGEAHPLLGEWIARVDELPRA